MTLVQTIQQWLNNISGVINPAANPSGAVSAGASAGTTVGNINNTIRAIGTGVTTGLGVAAGSTVAAVQNDIASDVNAIEVTAAKEAKTAAIWIALFIILAIGVFGLILPSDSGEYPVPIPVPA